MVALITKKWTYYNDHDPEVCEWARELIKAGLAPEGEVDGRSILDVEGSDLSGFVSCHFFCGILGWPHALRLAGWPDDRPVWTGSPPCQPFSVAGQRKGQDDSRHLAPHFLELVRACRPGVLFGEQVASAEVFGKVAGSPRKRVAGPPAWAWLDALYDGLEAAHYTVGAIDFPSASVGAPHIRQRTFFGAVRMGHPDGRDASAEREQHGGQHRQQPQDRGAGGLEHSPGDRWIERGADTGGRGATSGRGPIGMASTTGPGSLPVSLPGLHRGEESRGSRDGELERPGATGGMVDGIGEGLEGQPRDGHTGGRPLAPRPTAETGATGGARPTDGFWRDADWLFCRDDKFRPVEPGTFPLADGVSGRVGKLRGYGNAINPHQAAIFIKAFDESVEESYSF